MLSIRVFSWLHIRERSIPYTLRGPVVYLPCPNNIVLDCVSIPWASRAHTICCGSVGRSDGCISGIGQRKGGLWGPRVQMDCLSVFWKFTASNLDFSRAYQDQNPSAIVTAAPTTALRTRVSLRNESFGSIEPIRPTCRIAQVEKNTLFRYYIKRKSKPRIQMPRHSQCRPRGANSSLGEADRTSCLLTLPRRPRPRLCFENRLFSDTRRTVEALPADSQKRENHDSQLCRDPSTDSNRVYTDQKGNLS